MKPNLTCKKCGKKFNMLADGICFHCDPKHWDDFFNKARKKRR